MGKFQRHPHVAQGSSGSDQIAATEQTTPEQTTSNNATAEPEIWAVVGDVRYGAPETDAILKQRAKEWHELYPKGEPMYMRDDGYQAFLYTNQVMVICRLHKRTAQRMLAAVRKALGKKERNGMVSVKEFCHFHKLDEDEFRKALKSIPPDLKIG